MDDFFTWIIYFISLFFIVIYIIIKNKKRKYILSLTNPYILQYLFILYVVPIVSFSSIAWIKLLGDSAELEAENYFFYLLESVRINSFGFFVFTITMMIFEFNNKKPKWIYKIVSFSEKNIVEGFLKIEFIFCCFIYLVIVISTSGIGLLGEQNLSANDGVIYYFSFIMQVIINVLTLYFGIYMINNRKGKIYFIIGIIECILMGKRATLVMDILFGFVVYYLYKKRKNKNRDILLQSVKYIVIMVVFAIIMGELRSSNVSDFTLLDNIMYGNTFSDIRDGAMILYGFDNNFQSAYVYGSTYLSALISFIPSSIVDFRYNWDWGRFSTIVLLGPAWEGHPGLRGGWSMEGYLNFGILGIIFSAVISGYLYSSMEKYFYNEMFVENNQISEKAVLVLYILILLARRVLCSAGFFAIYVMIFFILFNILMGIIYKNLRMNNK